MATSRYSLAPPVRATAVFHWALCAGLAGVGLACGNSSSGAEPAGNGASAAGGNDANPGAVGGTSGGTGQTGGNMAAGASAATAGGTAEVRPDDVDFVDGVSVDTLAGGSEEGTADGDVEAARFSNPASIVRIDERMFVVADYDSGSLRMLDVEGNTSTVEGPDGFSQPYGLASLDGVVFAQTDTNSLGRKSPETGTLWRLGLDEGEVVIFLEDLGRPRSLAAIDAETLVVADNVHHVVSTIDLASGSVSPLAGQRGSPGYVDGSAEAARFHAPTGIVVRSDGSIVVADSGNRRLRLVTTAGDVSTLAGEGSIGTVDGPALEASFVRPRALAIDSQDNVYVSDDVAHRIRRLDASGLVTTVAGAGSDGNAFLDGAGSEALFAGQEGLAVSADGTILYVADGNGGAEVEEQASFHRIRRVRLP